MNLNINWDLVKARSLLSSIPEHCVKEYEEDTKHSNVGLSWGPRWIKNLKANVKKVGDLGRFGIMHLENRWAGKTAYLVGAGPSLKNNVNDIPKDGKIITNVHAVKFLIENGIKPDYVGVIDAYDRQAKWCDIGNESKGISLLMDINCSPEIFKTWKGPIIFFRTIGKGDTGLAKDLWDLSDMDHLIRSGGNVMTAMLYAARIMGMKKFVFIGHDYANVGFDFGVDYANGQRDTGKTSRGPKKDKFMDSMWGVDIQGLGVITLMRMWIYKFWTESFATGQKDCEFLNCTEGGILGSYPQGNLSFIKQCRLQEA